MQLDIVQSNARKFDLSAALDAKASGRCETPVAEQEFPRLLGSLGRKVAMF
jgi:hypothetical protein